MSCNEALQYKHIKCMTVKRHVTFHTTNHQYSYLSPPSKQVTGQKQHYYIEHKNWIKIECEKIQLQ